MKQKFVWIILGLVFSMIIFNGVYLGIKRRNQLIRPKLLIILIGGMRHDYIIRETNLRGFTRLASEGVRGNNTPVFPSTSMPNWYSLATGLYAESHGMVYNSMYDLKYDAIFPTSTDKDRFQPFWWNQAVPIWTLAENSGIRTSMYHWDGCEVEINEILPSYCVPYEHHGTINLNDNRIKNTIKTIDKILKDFKYGKFTLSLLYYDVLHTYGHKYGPDAQETRIAIKKTDELIYHLLERTTELSLENLVNLYVVSDYGIRVNQHTIYLTDHVDSNYIHYMVGNGVFWMILPLNSDTKELLLKRLEEIKGLKVYKKDNIPQEFHFSKNERILPLILIAEPGYTIFKNRDDNSVIGRHGHYWKEDDNMIGTFYAKGPAFKKGLVVDQMSQVDHFQVFCNVLGLEIDKRDSIREVNDLLNGDN